MEHKHTNHKQGLSIDWSKVLTYFVIVAIGGIAVTIATSFEPPKSKEVNQAQDVIIQHHEAVLDRMDKAHASDSTNAFYIVKSIKKINKKLGIDED